MKRHLQGLVTVLLLISWAGLPAQGDPLVTQFSARKSGDAVFLTWVISQGNACNGIDIERSADGSSFGKVGQIAGVCGDINSAQRFDFVDAAPLTNQVNYYRLSSQGDPISVVIQIEVVELGEGKYLAWPHPFADAGTVYFENPRLQACFLTLYNMQGNISWMAEARSERFDVDASALQNGPYLLVIHGADGVLVASGRVVVQH